MFNPNCLVCIDEQKTMIREMEKRGRDATIPRLLLKLANKTITEDEVKELKSYIDPTRVIKNINETLKQFEQIEV